MTSRTISNVFFPLVFHLPNFHNLDHQILQTSGSCLNLPSTSPLVTNISEGTSSSQVRIGAVSLTNRLEAFARSTACSISRTEFSGTKVLAQEGRSRAERIKQKTNCRHNLCHRWHQALSATTPFPTLRTPGSTGGMMSSKLSMLPSKSKRHG